MIKTLTFICYFLTLLNSFKSKGLGCGIPAARVRHVNPPCDLRRGILGRNQVKKPGRLAHEKAPSREEETECVPVGRNCIVQ